MARKIGSRDPAYGLDAIGPPPGRGPESEPLEPISGPGALT